MVIEEESSDEDDKGIPLSHVDIPQAFSHFTVYGPSRINVSWYVICKVFGMRLMASS